MQQNQGHDRYQNRQYQPYVFRPNFMKNQDGSRAAPVLQGEEVPFEDAQGHLGLGGCAAHDWVQRLCHLMQASEGNPKVVSILEESEVARDSVKVNPNSCGDIFPERLDVGLVPSSVPE